MEITTEYIRRLRTDYKFQPKKKDIDEIVKVINSRIDDLCNDKCELTLEIGWLFDCIDTLEKLSSWPMLKEFTFLYIQLRGNLARLEDEWAEMKEDAEKKFAKLKDDMRKCEPCSPEFMQKCYEAINEMCKRYNSRLILRRKYKEAKGWPESEESPMFCLNHENMIQMLDCLNRLIRNFLKGTK